MFRLIGAATILFSASMVGWQLGKYYVTRSAQLRALLLSLNLLETEIVYGSTPLHRAFEKIGQRVPVEVGNIFSEAARLLQTEEGASTQSCWEKAIHKHWSATALRKEEKEVLKSLGYVLGTSDGEDQCKHIKLAMTYLHSLEEEARIEQGKYEKMFKSLGFLCGLLVVILMF